MADDKYDAAALIDAMEQYHEAKAMVLPEGCAVALPRGMELKSIKTLRDEYLVRPERMRGTARIYTLDSLIEHANRFQTRWSAAFANDGQQPPVSPGAVTQGPSITVVYDYHEGNEAAADGGTELGEPDWCQHRAVYTFPLSAEWKAWLGAKEAMSQADFAAFIEDRIVDVLDPANVTQRLVDHTAMLGIELASPAKLLAISRSLAVRVESRAAQAVNLTTGECQIAYEEEHKDTNFAPLKVPGAFAIAIPVFRDGALYSISVRLRYRLSSGKITWWVSLTNTDRILADAVNEACDVFRAGTKIPLYYGAPEQGG